MEQDIKRRSCLTSDSFSHSFMKSNSSNSKNFKKELRKFEYKTTMLRLALLAATIAILTSLLMGSVEAQSSKGGSQVTSYAGNRASPSSTAPSPVAQLRQQQQQQNYAPATQSRQTSGGTKRLPQQQPQQNTYSSSPQQTGGYQQPQQQQQQQQEAATEDPLADSEPALYGSVAGQPGVDFPAYTRIPKTSFTCEGKGFDFGFYADEEAQCQVYHVCWSGRRESFLCGVGTVFNQAILACDYWHSVDCSKSSQFYGVNSELGKSNSEPASGSQRQPARTPVSLPAASGGTNYGANLNQNKRNQPQPQQQQQQQQQQQYTVNDDSNFDLPVQQQQLANEVPQSPVQVGSYRTPPPSQQQQQTGNSYSSTTVQSVPTFTPQRSQPQSYEYQQRLVHSNDGRTKTATNQAPRQQQAVSPPPPPPPPVQQQQVVGTKQRPRFNMDFNQKVNSLIESPIRAPLKSPASGAYGATKQRAQPQQQQVARQQPTNFAQLAVSRAQQAGSQQLNAGLARKGGYQQQQAPQQQQQQTYDNDIDEPQQQQQQQQQQNFDDSPVQTSTVQTTPASYGNSRQTNGGFVPQQMVIQAGNGLDGSTAITTQYDTLTPAGVPAAQSQANQNQQTGGANSDQSNYESSQDENNSGANDDFRSSGAKAAASHNQNWYIMRSI